jgi:multiple sugar transport system substrate-binding protein
MARMRMTRRQLVGALSVASCGTGLLTACGQLPGEVPSVRQSQPEAAPAARSAPTAPKAVALRWLDARAGWAGVGPVYDKQPELFRQQFSHITVTIEVVPDDQDRIQRLSAAQAAGQAPDLFTVRSLDVTTLYDRLADLTPFLSPNEPPLADLFVPAVRMYLYKGKQIALPRDINPYVLYYNLKLFHEAGLEPPTGWQWSDVAEKGRLLAKPDAKDPVYAILIPVLPESWMPLLWSFGGDWVNADSTRPTVNQPQNVEAVRFIADLMTKRRIAAPVTHEGQGGQAKAAPYFAAGQIALYMMVTGFAAQLKRANMSDNGYDIALNPRGPAGRATRAGGNGYAVLDSSRFKQESVEFIRWLLQPQVVTELVKNTRMLPSSRSIAYSDVFLRPGEPPASARIYVDSVEFARPGPQIPHYRDFEKILQDSLKEVWTGAREPEEALSQAQRQAEALFAAKGV